MSEQHRANIQEAFRTSLNDKPSADFFKRKIQNALFFEAKASALAWAEEAVDRTEGQDKAYFEAEVQRLARRALTPCK